MSIQEVSAERFAETFHHYFQALARDFGCSGRGNSDAWERVPAEERSCLIAATRLALMEVASETSTAHEKADDHHIESRKYFAKPGEAEWGC
jgi:hypothetical protein